MATTTSRLGLIKPGQSEYGTKRAWDANMDALDLAVGAEHNADGTHAAITTASITLGGEQRSQWGTEISGGTATGGSATTVVLSTASWGTNAWANCIVAVSRAGALLRLERVTSNTATTLTIPTGTAVAAGDVFALYGAGNQSLAQVVAAGDTATLSGGQTLTLGALAGAISRLDSYISRLPMASAEEICSVLRSRPITATGGSATTLTCSVGWGTFTMAESGGGYTHTSLESTIRIPGTSATTTTCTFPGVIYTSAQLVGRILHVHDGGPSGERSLITSVATVGVSTLVTVSPAFSLTLANNDIVSVEEAPLPGDVITMRSGTAANVGFRRVISTVSLATPATPVITVTFADGMPSAVANLDTWELSRCLPGHGASAGARYTGVATYARASSGLVYDPSVRSWVKWPPGWPRYGVMTDGRPGMLIESARTNDIYYSYDLTNALWAKTGITATLDQIGLLGGANTATTLTATASGGTCVYSSAGLANRYRATSIYLRRGAGSGTVTVTAWGVTTDVTASLPSTGWLVLRDLLSAAATTAFDVTITIANAGDSVVVAHVQEEATGSTSTDDGERWSTSPIPSNTSSFYTSRAADVLQMTASFLPFNLDAFTATARIELPFPTATGNRPHLFSSSANVRGYVEGGKIAITYGGVVARAASDVVANTPTTAACWLGSVGGLLAFKNGVSGPNATAGSPTGSQTYVLIGGSSATPTRYLGGLLGDLRIYRMTLNPTEMALC